MAIAYWLSNSYLAFSRSWSMVSVIWLEAFIAVQSCTRVANQGCEYKQCIHTHTEWGAVCFESQYMYGDNAFYCLQRCPSRRITDQHAMRLTASVYYCHEPPKKSGRKKPTSPRHTLLCTPSSTKSVVRNMVFSTSKPRNTSLQNQIFQKSGGHSIGVRKADFCRKFSQLN